MPSIPYIVEGTVTDENSSVVSGVGVTVNNTTQNTYTSTVTDVNGNYLLDLVNCGWSLGDNIVIKVSDGNVFGHASFTVAGTSYVQDVNVNSISVSTISDKSWKVLYDFFQEGDYALSTDSIFSAMSDNLVSDNGYPVVIIETPLVSEERMVLSREHNKKYSINFLVKMFHNTSKDCKQLRDEVYSSLNNGWKNLAGNGLTKLTFLSEDNDMFLDGGKKVHAHVMNFSFVYVGD